MIFAPNLYSMGLMESRDYENYRSLFDLMSKFLQAPDLLIYLRASVPTLMRQIAKRNRDYEQSIQLEYLENLNRRYDEFIFKDYKGRLMVIEKDTIDFEHHPKDFASIVDRIDSTLFGLFPPSDNWPLNHT